MNLFVFGRGYSASHYLRSSALGFGRISATTRGHQEAEPIDGVEDLVFNGDTASPMLRSRLAQANVLLVSVPPNAGGDPVLAHWGSEIAGSTGLRCIVYLSTIGVYGDHGGAWVDETTLPKPKSARSTIRLMAEEDWLRAGRELGCATHILRLAGIYGPRQNALENLRAGTARRINKTGQVFNRIHVSDIAAAIDAAVTHASGGVWNISDDEPAPPQDVIAYAAGLLGIEPPPEVNFEDAEMTAMARNFYSENKRVSNRRLRQVLGLQLAYPTYREGILALAHAL